MSGACCDSISIIAAASRSRGGAVARRAALLALTLWAPLGGVAHGADDALRRAQRLAFVAAEQALENDQTGRYRALAATLRHYPLFPYLRYRELSRDLSSLDAADVDAFLERYPSAPPSRRLRRDWLRYLGQAGRWRQLLRVRGVAAAAAASDELDCWRRQALWHSGRAEQALDGIAARWLVGRSQADSCDPLFRHWRERGGLTQTLIWQRFRLALDANQVGLAGYLKKRLEPTRQRQAERWLTLHGKPQRALTLSLNDPDVNDLGALLHALFRWARRDSVAAAAAWDTLSRRYRFPPELDPERRRLQRRLALYVAARRHPSAARRLAALPAEAVDEEVEQWRAREALARGDWPALQRWVETMSAALRERPRWRYWRARSLAVGGERARAQQIYRSLSDERDYHGFLAADRLGKPYRMHHRPLAVDAARLETLRQRPGLRRAYEFWALRRLPQARVEWRDALAPDDDDTALQRAAARLAQSWGWHDRAIAAAAKAKHWDDLELRFPLPHRQQVRAYADEQRIDPAWVYAVMRQESLFQSDVRSGAGALGLMQLLPGTGRQAARALGAPRPGRAALLRVDNNIRYGAFYLRQTMNRLQDSPLLATAAYNAGPGRVRQWLPATAAEAADVWAETIPYKETRRYVQRVMEYATVYGWRLRQSPRKLSRSMAQVRPSSQL